MLKIENLKASIGEVEILKGVDLEIKPGELHAVMGPNGSGKSTLCHVVMGNKDYKSEGSIFIDEEEISKKQQNERSEMGVFQSFQYPVGLPGVTLLEFSKIINPDLYDIEEQIDIFANADKIIAPHGSNLANIIFCKPDTEIFEITPPFGENEKIFQDRYFNLSLINNLKYKKILCDVVDVQNHSSLAKKYIHKNVLSQSNYYKNLIVKIRDLNIID